MAAPRRKRKDFRSEARRSPQLQRALTRLGMNTRAQRAAKGLTQEEAANRAGLDPKHFQEIEAGRINVTMATMVGIAFAFEVSLTELVRDDSAGLP